MKKAYGRTQLVLEIVGGLLLIAMLLFILREWGQIPDTIPAHVGPDGKIDQWDSKWSLLFMPAVGIGLYILLTVVSRLPRLWYLPETNARGKARLTGAVRVMLTILKVELAAACCYITYYTMRILPLPRVFVFVFFCVLLITLVACCYWLSRVNKRVSGYNGEDSE